MAMKYGALILIASLVTPFPVFAQDSATLTNGQKIVAFANRPDEKDKCHRKAALQERPSEFLKDGKYETVEGSVFLMNHGCLLPRTGVSQLKDGTPIEFYQEDVFADGEVAFIFHEGSPQRLPTGTYNLLNEQEFSVTDGVLENYGLFDEDTGRIKYEDRN